ncbi:hypothetical protein DSM21852_19540 [Methylocystis bryophila]|nr:hypothetical protein DSM21852_19540 [Methylocystis bryophila]
MRVFEKIAEPAFRGLIEKAFNVIAAETLSHQHAHLFGTRQALKMKHASAALLIEKWGHCRKITFPKPVGGPAGNSELWWGDLEQFLNQGVYSVTIASASTLFIQPIDEQYLLA